ncbi:MAG: hypothetical protein Q4A18_01785 [Rikenellaceae bacterium]|nr:hypothetical protein [Rikenellaceae bacterium]
MSWQEWVVWAIFAVAVIIAWRWMWRAFFCRSRDCENCKFGHCGIRSKEWDQKQEKKNE